MGGGKTAFLKLCLGSLRIPQTRIKQLAGKSNLSEEYIDVLPAVPRDLLTAHPDLALAVFSAEHPPVSCPLHMQDISVARSKILMRGGSLMRNYLHVVSAECGYNRTHRACMHDAATLRSVCASGSFHLHQHALSMERPHPQATTIASWNGRHWENLPLPDASGAPSTLTIFRPPSPVSDCHSRMQSMIEASTFPNGFGPPPLPAPSAESPASTFPNGFGPPPAAADLSTSHLPPILAQAPPAAADLSTSHLPAIMDGSVGPADGVKTKQPLTAAQIRDKVLVARVLVTTDRKARVSFSFTTLTNGAVTTAPKHACVDGSASLLSYSSLPER